MTSTIKVNNIQNQCGANIINESSNTITIGASGDTIALASGASQSGFGREGSVDWQTGSIKTTTFTAANGEGYFCNTTGGTFTATLPASPSAGDIVAFKDYGNSFGTNKLTIGRNSSNIGGVASDLDLETNQQSITFVYVDGTKGWLATTDSTSNAIPTKFVTATGGTITTSGNFKIHTFTGPGTFTVSCAGNPIGSNTVSYMVVAGGGAGGKMRGGAGGAGGYRESKSAFDCYSASPLNATSGPTYNLPVTAQAYPITVGGGAAAADGSSSPPDVGAPLGGSSTFSSITSTGGGKGGGSAGEGNAVAGGSGGGGISGAGASGNTPSVSPPQGNDGGTGVNPGNYGSGGGGGAGGAGSPGPGPTGGVGGAGTTSCITASPVTRAGGGGGSTYNGGSPGPAHPGGGGGGAGGAPGGSGGANGTDNTGGGGGGGYEPGPEAQQAGGNGGSGIVVIRYKYQ